MENDTANVQPEKYLTCKTCGGQYFKEKYEMKLVSPEGEPQVDLYIDETTAIKVVHNLQLICKNCGAEFDYTGIKINIDTPTVTFTFYPTKNKLKIWYSKIKRFWKWIRSWKLVRTTKDGEMIIE